MIVQQQEPGVEHHSPVVILQHRGFLIINQQGFHTATKVSEGANQRFIGVFSILLGHGENLEATGETQRINREVNFASLSVDFNFHFALTAPLGKTLMAVGSEGYSSRCP